MKNNALFEKRLRRYAVGGIGALVLTGGSFVLVMNHAVNGFFGGVMVLCFAAAQAVIQLYYFLHLGEEKKPYWKSISFLFTTITVLIIISGSVWVVSRMNYHMMLTPTQTNQYMETQNKEGF